MRALILTSVALAACGPSNEGGGACKEALIAGDLVITEIFADYSGPDEGKEWFEIVNASDRPLDLKGLTIVHNRPDDSKEPKTHVIGDLTIAPGQYVVLGNAAPDLVPSYVSYGYGDDLGDMFNTDGGKLALTCGDDEIDAAVYDTVKAGHARELTAAQAPDYTLNDDLAQWCEGSDTEFETDNFGTPGEDNDCVPVVAGLCNDAGTMREAALPAAGDLVITEVMPSPAKVSDTTGEWFEAKVMKDVDLNGVALDRAGDSSGADTVTSADCIHVVAGDTVVFAKSTDMVMNGGLPAAAIKGTFGFAMVAGSAASPGDVQILAGTTVIDAITWTKSGNGASLQLDPDLIDPGANDSESNFCAGTAAYGAGDLGTPGADNAQCVLLPPAGMCDDGGTIRPIVKPKAGELVITEFLANPANVTDGTTDAQKEWFEITNTGAASFDLNELTAKNLTSTTVTTIASASCIKVAPGGFAVFARSADSTKNTMLPKVDVTINFSLVDTGNGLQVLDGTTVLDQVSWTSVTSGASLQLDPDKTNATDNDTAAVTPGVYCLSLTAYGDMTNKASPGAANAQCP